MDNFVIDPTFDVDDERLSSLLLDLRKCYVSAQNNFAQLCKTIYSIWDYCKGHYFKAKQSSEYYNCYKLLAKFGFDKKAVSRYKQCYERFIHVPSCTVDTLYLGFSPSKLFELLPLSAEICNNAIETQLITPSMTVKEIRETIKNIKDGTEKTEKVVEKIEINEDDIPMAYDPKKKYDYKYFESKTKSQLLNIVWELQKEYQKLKAKKEK